MEARVLDLLKAENLVEYFEIDEELNAIRYFRPIRLTDECILCQGDPSLSQVYWDNDEGLDPTGVRMEGWKVGEIHGAFEVIQSLGQADSQLAKTARHGLFLVLALWLLGMGAFWVLICRSISHPLSQVMQATEQIVKGDISSATVDVKSSDEIGQLSSAYRALIGYIGSMADAADRLAQGDLTVEVQARSDIDTLAKSFAGMAAKLRNMIGRMGTQANELGVASAELTRVADEVTDNVSGVSANATSVAAVAEQMSVNMKTVSSSAEQSSSNIVTVATSTEEITATISEIANNAEVARQISSSAVRTVAQAATRIGSLGEAAERIGTVIEVIVDIAERTKRLALNATIEAASAEDAGKGFAVVASEVKELAKQTSDASEEIRTSIAAMQDSTRSTVSEIGDIQGVISEVDENIASIAAAVEEQAVTTRDIAENVSRASDAVTSVTDNVREAATASTGIASEIDLVNRASNSLSEAMQGVNGQARDLAQLGSELRHMVDQFRLDVDSVEGDESR